MTLSIPRYARGWINGRTTSLISAIGSIRISQEFQRKKRILQIRKGDILFVETLDIANNRIMEQLRGIVSTIIYRTKRQRWQLPEFTLIPAEKLSLIEDRYFMLVRKEDLEKVQNSMETMRTLITDYKDRFRLARTRQRTLP